MNIFKNKNKENKQVLVVVTVNYVQEGYRNKQEVFVHFKYIRLKTFDQDSQSLVYTCLINRTKKLELSPKILYRGRQWMNSSHFSLHQNKHFVRIAVFNLLWDSFDKTKLFYSFFNCSLVKKNSFIDQGVHNYCNKKLHLS